MVCTFVSIVHIKFELRDLDLTLGLDKRAQRQCKRRLVVLDASNPLLDEPLELVTPFALCVPRVCSSARR
jgi:hypothetical protein